MASLSLTCTALVTRVKPAEAKATEEDAPSSGIFYKVTSTEDIQAGTMQNNVSNQSSVVCDGLSIAQAFDSSAFLAFAITLVSSVVLASGVILYRKRKKD